MGLAEKMVQKGEGSEEDFKQIAKLVDKLGDGRLERNIAEAVMEGVAVNPGWCVGLRKYIVGRVGELWKRGDTMEKARKVMTNYDEEWFRERPGKELKRRAQAARHLAVVLYNGEDEVDGE